MLTKVKDTLRLGKQSNVVYRIPCSCSKVYIGETKWTLEARVKEHGDACNRGMMERSAIAEQAWEKQQCIDWKDTSVVDKARGYKGLILKEAVHILMTPAEDCFNCDGGMELPGCWIATLKTLGGRG